MDQEVLRCYAPGELSHERIVAFLKIAHERFPEVLSSAYDVDDFAKKISAYAHGVVLLDTRSSEWMGGCFGYCNDFESRIAYITFIAKAVIHGNQIGRRLMEAFVKLAASLGMEKVRLEVDKKNKGAREFYARMGFSLERDCGSSIYMIKNKILPLRDLSCMDTRKG